MISKSPTSPPRHQLRKSTPTPFCRAPDDAVRTSARPSKANRKSSFRRAFPQKQRTSPPHRHSNTHSADEGSNAPHSCRFTWSEWREGVGARVPAAHLRARGVPAAGRQPSISGALDALPVCYRQPRRSRASEAAPRFTLEAICNRSTLCATIVLARVCSVSGTLASRAAGYPNHPQLLPHNPPHLGNFCRLSRQKSASAVRKSSSNSNSVFFRTHPSHSTPWASKIEQCRAAKWQSECVSASTKDAPTL